MCINNIVITLSKICISIVILLVLYISLLFGGLGATCRVRRLINWHVTHIHTYMSLQGLLKVNVCPHVRVNVIKAAIHALDEPVVTKISFICSLFELANFSNSKKCNTFSGVTCPRSI